MSKIDFSRDIEKSIEVLKKGGVILYPTDTIWGIGCDATNTEAVERVFEIKQRDESKSLIVLLASDGQLQRYVSDVPDVAWDILDLSEKPTTVIFSNSYNLSAKAVAEDGSVGIRITKDEFCKTLIRKLNKPLISTSANVSGQKTPGNFSEISPEILRSVDYVVEHRQDERKSSAPSTIIKVGKGGLIDIIRK